MQLSGVGVSPGRVAGPRVVVVADLREPASSPVPDDLRAEAGKIGSAAESVAASLSDRARSVSGDARSVLETTAAMASDPALLASAEKRVLDGSLPAPRAVWEAAGEFMTALRAAGGYMAERAADVADVRDRIVASLSGLAPPGVPELTSPSVLVARDLAPADTAGLDPDLVLALVTEEGGPTSHTAILARALGIPAVVACAGVLGLAGPGLVVDGSAGTVSPSDGRVVAPARTSRPEWDGVGRLADGHRVKLLTNVGSASDARAAAAAGAEGIGLFRTEFCYLSATSEPTESSQRAAYAAVLEPFAGKPVVVRTLDAGSDKPLAFLDMGAEPNPALGVRGLRIAFDRPDLLDRQLTAIVAAAADTGVELSVMAPMVATAAEAAWFASRARAAGIGRVGVMIEIPAAALCAAEILAEVDFVSLGTNDLAQYVFAADRQLGAVAALNDPHQPALLRLVGMVAEAGAAAGKPVGVCGEAAADPALAPVLAGLGVTSLSMNAVALAGVGAALRAVDLAACRALA
ncbi:Phosphoenolpyruvate-protein phosphotransferase of PTS system (EC [Amycolatopsis camponoti]|uniref:Phosphoenolpyruvate-protein phosphotransferase n=1 Tax=Amycolatopsis camponoti TaxID=2606593 RepID=A0A6I8LQR9_9PSEU|nr:phosphoenolpyruvate--protein phosphotransferase [Amycolatopsis camponoti]VVJ18878.1 Phosphoenolpyruvate-protein phosphotransferase of PTS system (EC [Amycolatopsis camponoti]